MRHDKILTGVYHKAQEKIWDGRTVLSDTLQKHGGHINLPEDKMQSLARIFTMILKGEDAAWRISLQLGSMLNNIPARMAATSQAHDEARHFYVMRDYLKLCNQTEVQLPSSVLSALDMVLETDSLPRKLLGMQLMVEPVALTIFQEIKRINVEPVLSELLAYFEIDEARHVTLGVQHLPVLMRNMGTMSLLGLTTWQYKMFMLELKGLKELKPDFENLGLCPNKLFDLAEKKQLQALKEVSEQLGWSPIVWDSLQSVLRYQKTRVLG
tara:strand:- start:1678 stop:2481 length:804 start_codon:yes stop_codon:yes gene_type:complete